jgi:hypothetical protein
MNALAPIGLIPQGMDDAIRLAKAMSTIKELPKHLHDSVGTCLMVVDQALRWQMSPFAVAQESANIQGKMMYSGKLMAAAVESMGAIRGGFDYRFEGEGDDRTVTVSAVRTGETEPRQMKIRLGDVKTDNAMWKKQPDQQLVYSGSRNWARRWTPAALLGAYSPEEFPHEPAQEPPHNGPTLEHVANVMNAVAAALKDDPAPPKPETRREAINRETPLNPTPPPTGDATPPKPANMPGFKDFLKSLEIAVRDCTDIHQVNRVIARPDTQFAMATYKDVAARELKAIIAEGVARWRSVGTEPDMVPPADEADIWGEEPAVTEPAGAG